MIVFPAIDLLGGQVVRLTEGDYGRKQAYGMDPLEAALSFRDAGATHLHVVDLGGARDGVPQETETLRRLARESGLSVQVGGGIRTEARIEALLSLGVTRTILGTAALRDADFLARMVARYGERIAVGVDARDGKVAVSGWTEVSDRDAMAFCRDLRDLGVRTVIYTDIARDGNLSGANLPAYEALAAIDGLSVIASGGITGEAEIVALRGMGLYGAIIGKALYEGRLSLPRALALAAEGGA